jgi:hypothetical protein
VQVDNMGIDGRMFPVGTRPAEAAAKIQIFRFADLCQQITQRIPLPTS